MAYNSCVNFPYIGVNNWGILEVLSTGAGGFIQRISITRSPGEHPILFERMFNGDNWSEWGQISLATPPQEYDLPLADGWTAWKPSLYWKTQDNVVTLMIGVRASVAHDSGATIGTLPEGFRPSFDKEVSATIGKYTIGTAHVNSSGLVRFFGTSIDINGFVFAELSFIAKN